MKYWIGAMLILGCVRAVAATSAPGPSEMTPVFVSGENEYNTYRIPALITAKSGALLAFCEGRRGSSSDTGDIDLLVKRSEDGGATWSKFSVIWDDADNTCGNPCPVLDQDTGVLWLLMTWNLGADKEAQIIARTSQNTRRVSVTCSEDDGRTWAAPKDITASVKPDNWTWYATGPGVGIQLRLGAARGRLVIPCDHIEAESKKYFSHVIFSDDHGKTWQLGGRTPADKVNECQVVERQDGSLMLNMRNYENKDQRVRAISISSDGGMTWGPIYPDPALPEPVCQASLIRCYEGNDCLVFANPADPEKRVKMTVRASLDHGKSWPAAQQLHAGPAAYSCLVELPGGDVGILYEAGEKNPYEGIVFQRFPKAWLLKETDAAKTR